VSTPCHDGRARGRLSRQAAEDPKFAARAGRRKHITELYHIINAWFAGKTRRRDQKRASQGVPFGPIFTPASLLERPSST